MPTVRPPLILAVVLYAAWCGSALAQDPKQGPPQPSPRPDRADAAQPKFPEDSWRPATITDKQRLRLPKRCRVGWSRTGKLRLELKRPRGYVETIVTSHTGAVLGRSKGRAVDVAALPIATRYVVYASQPTSKRYLHLFESFVEFPKREFPTTGWKPKPQANLTLSDARQFAPKTMRESFDKPHEISFAPDSPIGSRLYILTKIEAGGKEQVASQAITGRLRFWPHAKRGESFRVYEVDPASRSYRVTKPMTVAASYPLGR